MLAAPGASLKRGEGAMRQLLDYCLDRHQESRIPNALWAELYPESDPPAGRMASDA